MDADSLPENRIPVIRVPARPADQNPGGSMFGGWIMCRNSSADELGGAGNLYKAWRFLARYVSPVAILFVFLQTVGVI